MKIPPILLVLLSLPTTLALGDGPDALIDPMDELSFRPPAAKASIELVDGKVGRAIRFRFDEGARGAFCIPRIRGNPDWDRSAGFSFWVKGDGPTGFGGLEFIFDEDYAVRYDYCFPIKGMDWTKVTVAWNDLIPVLPGPNGRPLGRPGGNPPSKLAGPWVGKWWYWGDYPALAFAIDEIRWEPIIDRPAVDHRPTGPPLGRVLARLQAGRPVTIVTMGDSLTDKRHWSNRQVAWVDLLRDQLRAKYGSEITIVNPAIGGNQLRQNLILMPRWLDRAPEPDLVTIFFGGNDREAGMTAEEFGRSCTDAADRIRRATGGRSDVLFLTTAPPAANLAAAAGFAEAVRKAAVDRNAGLADVESAIRRAGESDPNRLYVDDRVHLGRPGHEIVAEVVLKAIQASGTSKEVDR